MKKYLIFTPALLLALSLTSCSDGKQHYDLHKTLALFVIIAIITMFFLLAFYSNMLRDEINDCEAFDAHAEKVRRKVGVRFFKSSNPFSLSRVQLAVWTVVIACSYIYLELCMGNCSTTGINQTALILMGISAAVTTGSTLMDKREIQDGRDRHQNAPSEGFFVDILSDDNGISIHRFQNVIWTAIAIIIYLNKIYSIRTGCALPELSETLLALTGISSVTYLAIKSQENNPAIEYAEENSPVNIPDQSAAAVISASYAPAATPSTPVNPVTAQTDVNAMPASPDAATGIVSA
ncbi:hypothetical protein [Mucilaginibacter lacusdianchii]|uniref:hypothetical protein n=1 Tax=Mucilaginibacter lacusdianchii TaxID=2684211 RepID=UPI00131CE379|nr:hypothetical protein [Mucilaginibacter sp. JXJ CY 39]